jgi:hypothetical protein
MNRKTLVGLALAAAVALVVAIVLQVAQRPRSEADAGKPAEALAPGLAARVNDVDKVVVTGAGNMALATLVRGADGWELQEKGGYAVDTGKLRAFLLRLADSKLLEPKTANAERYAALGVDDVGGADAKGLQVELGGLPQPLKLVIGNANTRGGSTFVRRAGEKQSWLASGALAPEKTAVDWLVRDLLDVDAARIAEVTLTGPDGKVVRTAKAAEGEANFKLAEVPKGREPASEYAVNSLASGLDGLRFDDVVPAAVAAPPEGARKARFDTFDGLVVEAIAWEADGKHNARFNASLDDGRAARHAEAALATTAAAGTTSGTVPATDAADARAVDASADKPAAATPGVPGAASDPAKDREARLAKVREEVATLQRRFDGWTFVVPAYKYAGMEKSLDDLLKPLDAKKGAAPKSKAAPGT